MNLKVSIDPASLDRVRDRLSPARIDIASRQALNLTLRNLRAELSQRMGKRIALKASVIKDHMRDYKASNTSLEASLSVYFMPISLRLYPHSVSKRRGLSARVLRGEARKPVPRAFIGATFGGSVYQREKGKPKRMVTAATAKGRKTNIGQMKQPISKLHGPSVRATAEPILKELYDSGWIVERLTANLANRLGFALRGRKEKAVPEPGPGA